MKPTRISTLAVVAVVCALVAWLLLRSVYEQLPPLPWTGVPALLMAARRRPGPAVTCGPASPGGAA